MKRAPAKRKPPLDVIEFRRDNAGEWRWHQVAANGNIRADGGEGYKRRVDAVKGFERHKAKLLAWEYVVRFIE